MIGGESYFIPFTYGHVLILWKGLVNFYGMGELSQRCSMQHENIRELLMKLAVIWADNPIHLDVIMETVQILTILMCMTFKAQMDGESDVDTKTFEISTWVPFGQTCPVPKLQPPAPLRVKLGVFVKSPDMKERLIKELNMALDDMKTFMGHAESIPPLLSRFQLVSSLLDDVDAILVPSMAAGGAANP
eukprot:s246_g15.t1